MNLKLNDLNKPVLIALLILIGMALTCHISNFMWGRERFNDNSCDTTLPAKDSSKILDASQMLPAGFAVPQNLKYTNITYLPCPAKILKCESNTTTPQTTKAPLDDATLGLLYKTMYERAGLEVMKRYLS